MGLIILFDIDFLMYKMNKGILYFTADSVI